MLFLLTDFPHKLKLEKIHGTLIILFYANLSSPQLQELFFFPLKTQKTATLQQVTGGNTPNLILKRMVRYFQKIPPLKKILQLEDRTCFFIKNTKNKHSLASEWWGNSKSGCKENARTVSKNYTTREKIKILRLKKDCETYIKKRNFKPEIKPMIEI